jgi:hypothetical protein
MTMGYTYSKVEIEGVGVFIVPLPVWELLRDESARAEAAEAENRLFKERVRRVAECHARSSADWTTVLADLGYQQPFWYPGDKEIHDLYRRAEAAEAEVSIQRDAAIHYHEQWLAAEAEAARIDDLARQTVTALVDKARAAEAEVARLRAVLTFTQDLLRDAPVADYLETEVDSGQDATGG